MRSSWWKLSSRIALGDRPRSARAPKSCSFFTSTTSLSSNTKDGFLLEMFSLQGRTAIVTGGGTGIGAAIAMGLARAGAHVVLLGRRPDPLQSTCAQIQAQLQQDHATNVATYIPCDLLQYDKLESVVHKAQEVTQTPPTIVIHNAGINVRQPAADLTLDHWERSLQLMLTAPFFLTRLMIPHMEKEGYGRIVTIASLQSYQAFPNSIPYASAKAGILGWTRAVAQAYGTTPTSNITANAIAPGFVQTELTASVFADQERAKQLAHKTILKRNSVPGDLVGATVFLASPAASYITGQTIPVDGGFTALGHD